MADRQQPDTSWWSRNWKWLVGAFLLFTSGNSTASDTDGGGLLPALMGPVGLVLVIWGIVEWRRRVTDHGG